MSVSCEMTGIGLCDGPITRQAESYRLWCVTVCDIETMMRRPWPALGCCPRKNKKKRTTTKMKKKKSVMYCVTVC